MDEGFAQAYAGLALAYSILPAYSEVLPAQEALEQSTDFALHALAIDPGLPEAYAALANNSIIRMRRSTAVALLDRAIALRPSFATAHQWRATILMSNGDLAGAIASIERASELDPRSLVTAENQAWILLTVGRNAEARAACARVLEFAPDYQGCLAEVGLIDLLSGNYVEAKRNLDHLAEVFNPSASGQSADLIAALAGKADRRALALRLAALPLRSRLDPASGNALEDYQVAPLIVRLGENELAIDYMDRISRGLGNDIDWAIMIPVLDPIRCEPRFRAIVARIRSVDPHAAKVCAGKP